MTALVVVALICLLFAITTWIADRTQPNEPEPNPDWPVSNVVFTEKERAL